jgi:hypothetical protein
MLGPPEAVRVISSACSAELCLAKTAGGILWQLTASPLPDGRGSVLRSGVRNIAGTEPRASASGMAAPPGPALFAFDGTDAVVYFPAVDQFARWSQGRLTRLAWHVEGEVLALRRAEIAVRRGADVWIVRPDGTILDYLGEVAGPVLLFDGAAVLVSGDELILRRPAAEDLRFELPGIQGLSALGPEYVQVNTATASYVLRTTLAREDLLLLPAPVRSRRVGPR